VPDYLEIYLPADIEPMERGERFEDPLNRALRQAGRLGQTVGGGTGMMVSPFRVTCCHVELEVKHLDRALPVIRDVLARADAPVGTIVGHPESDTILIHVTPAGAELFLPSTLPLQTPPPRYPWAAGEVVGYRLTPDRFVLLHILINDHRVLVLKVPDWCGPILPGETEVRELLARRETRYMLAHPFLFQTGRLGPFPFPVRPRPGRCLSRRRTVRTDIVADDGPRSGPHGVNPAWFDRVLKQMFGLVPSDGATRLWNDFGLRKPHLAAWDAGGRSTAAQGRKLFDAYACRSFVPHHPDRVGVATTENLKRFVADLKQHFHQDDTVWGGGSFDAGEGFVIIPVAEGRQDEVWAAAVGLGRQHGITCYDARRNRVGPRS
jgi:hypothetical protein